MLDKTVSTKSLSKTKKRKSGIPTGNAGEYFVMGELLRRGYDAQLADRNTKDYDILVGRADDSVLRKIQIKTVKVQPWYVKRNNFEDERIREWITIYVLLGKEDCKKPVRYFITKNRDLANRISVPSTWSEKNTAFMMFRSIEQYEDRWDVLGGA
jgi:hypothetical protein